MSFVLYLAGVVLLACGLAYGAHLAGLGPQWIGAGVVVVLGLGIITAVSRTRSKDPPA